MADSADDDVPVRRFIDDVEVVYLCSIISVAVAFNFILFTRLLTSSKAPTVRTSFYAGPYQLNSFSLFKLNLCIGDFCIILIHALGKVIWLLTYDWRLGDVGCRAYQLLSALSFYASSNIVVAIGLDRLKVVYTRHLQGATSVRRVRIMVATAWLLATVSSIPQALIWRTMEVRPGWHQCVTIFTYHNYMNTSTPTLERIALIYEMSHQALVFWIPFLIIFFSYLMIVLKLLLHHTFRAKENIRNVRPSEATTERQDTELLTVQQSSPKRKWSSVFSMDKTSEGKAPPNSPGLLRVRSVPAWRRQLRSRVFRSALAVVLAHVTMWLPYNCLSTLRFVHYEAYSDAMANGGTFLEDLIVVNSLLNPLLYGLRTRTRRTF